ncbi:MAG: hypothetical protein RLZ81_3236, partial [Pseudomonadota bacterium]
MRRRLGFMAALGVALVSACGGGDDIGNTATTVWPAVSTAIPAVPSEFAEARKAGPVLAPRALVESTNEHFFDWVEQLFPELLTSHQPTLTDGPWSYRAYFQPGVMVGVNDGKVYLLGGAFGNQLLYVGRVADFPSSPVLQAQGLLAAFDASLATSAPATGAQLTELYDGCYLGEGLTKAVATANYDEDRVQSIEAHKYRIGSTRTDVQVLADRTLTNTDGSRRRELD